MNAVKSYTLQKLGNGKYLIIGTDYTRFDELLPELVDELKGRRFEGTLVFDLLLSNGNNSSRFYEAHFNGSSIERNSIKRRDTPEPQVLEKVKRFLARNLDILHNGVLTSSEIKRIIATF